MATKRRRDLPCGGGHHSHPPSVVDALHVGVGAAAGSRVSRSARQLHPPLRARGHGAG